MKSIILVALLISGLSLTFSDEVQSYVDEINAFIKKTNSFTYASNNRLLRSTDKECTDNGKYDFIIVGAGTSGSLLANRLSESGQWKILVLESGGPESRITDIPAMFDYLRMSEFNWGYNSTSQKNSLKGMLNNRERIPRGRVIGGSSTVNAMMYVRGNPKDFDDWGKNNPGWSYADLLPLFKRSENAIFPNQDPNYHGHAGGLRVEQMNPLTPLTKAYLDANVEVGTKILDYNGESQMGVSMIQMMSVNGTRGSAGKSFLVPSLGRSNLQLIIRALVTKLLLKENIARGVEFVKDGKRYCAQASKEVILSAGALNSPQLLMLSGIGPKYHLRSLKIPVVKDLPVGNNLWDHLQMGAIPIRTNATLVSQTLDAEVKEYLGGTGRLTDPSGIQALRFISSTNDPKFPDIEQIFVAGKVPNLPYEYFVKTFNYNENSYDQLYKSLAGKVVWNVISILLHPVSRGSVRLASNSPYDFPLIDPRYLSDARDVKTLLKAVKETEKMANTKSMRAYDSTVQDLKPFGCKYYKLHSDAHKKCLIQHYAQTIHHWAGTAKMGPSGDKHAVVDPQLKVHGFKNLRVVDCSVIPVTTSGHTAAVAYVIAEKASDMINADYPSQK